jgi:A/G-specific adenine glycosylase
MAPSTLLLDWFAQHGRDLPWRHTRDPYRILVSEVMLQQTQVERVIPKYHSFLTLFPDVTALAAAPAAAVITAWQGLGYNRRALYLQRTAQAVVHSHGGVFPQTVEALLQLPGIGPYTAGAVACFAYEHPVAFMDVNIRRVVVRIWSDPVQPIPPDRVLLAEAAERIPAGAAWAWNQALMELGATVCTAKSPACPRCPLRGDCRDYAARRAADQQLLPLPPRVTKRVAEKPPARFIGSDRYYRGRIVDVLRAAALPGLTAAPLVALISHADAPLPHAEFQRIVDGLVRDGLVVCTAGHYTLPLA